MTDAQPPGGPVSDRGVVESHVIESGPAEAGPAAPGPFACGPVENGARDFGAAAPAGGPRPPARPRRGSRWRTAFFLLAGTGIIAAVAWALLGDRVLVVRSVSVTGTRLVAPAQVLAAADVGLGTPLVRVDTGAVTRRVEAIRQVASATVTKDWPDHLAITVTERVPAVAVRMAGGGYDLVDPTGTIVRWAKTRPARLPLLSTALTGRALRGDPGVAAAAGVLAELGPALSKSVSAVSVAKVMTGGGASVVAAERVTLSLRGGKTVLWGDASDAAQKNRELTILLRGSAHYLDVSAPTAVVTR